ncbi:MAG TPA: 1-deoxy-D-xylulose-5-phosphate synthase [Chloroflexota bacterium]|nr:1-deoxy-D-xylulose-5-phosphate synthase [Chloroflexota bacterium]
MRRILDSIDHPRDLRTLNAEQLEQLASEVRAALIASVTQTGGHLSSDLGTIELTIAVHSVFDSPYDKIVWDTGHQAYPHKMLTGRLDRLGTIRQLGGISGFLMREESEHDQFGAGHASTSISAALGMAVARDLRHENHAVVAIIGDGALTGGLAYEAINNAGQLGTPLIVILNDNAMSISPNVGAIAHMLERVRTDPRYSSAKGEVENILTRMPMGDTALGAVKRVKRSVKDLMLPNMFWEELGFTYLGPVDGHDIGRLQEVLRRARQLKEPVLVHAHTVKGKGYDPAEADNEKLHSVSAPSTKKAAAPNYDAVFGQTLISIADQDPRVVAITAGMCAGTGLTPFSKRFRERFFDVGIAEEHAITFAAGLATQGIRPVAAIYSTFLQRAYDQVIHDVCAQNLHVVFALDRAGLVGNDGRTHQGVFDLSYLRVIPNMVVMAPMDENELRHMLYTAIQHDGPVAIRYPRGPGYGVPIAEPLHTIEIGRAEVLRRGNDAAVLAIGATVMSCLQAAEQLAAEGIECTVVNTRFVKPIDETIIEELARQFTQVVTVEENVIAGGFGSAVAEAFERSNAPHVVVHRLGVPDRFIDHASQTQQREMLGLSPASIAEEIRARLPRPRHVSAGGG